MTKVTLENEFGVYSVGTEANVEVLDCLLERVVKPCLVAVGYSRSLVDEIIPIGDALDCYEE